MERTNPLITDRQVSVCWFRRDLRLEDNHALYRALVSGTLVLPIFIFDKQILDQLDNPNDRRVDFIFGALSRINRELAERWQSGVQIYYGSPVEVFEQLIATYSIKAVYCNEDYEPYALERDQEVRRLLETRGVAFHSVKDQVIFHREEITKQDGSPYTVYTPYSRMWLAHFRAKAVESYPSERHLDRLLRYIPDHFMLDRIGFNFTGTIFTPPVVDTSLIAHYDETRNLPGLEKGVSRLSVHLRFGTLSIRSLVKVAEEWNETYLKELIWREFFMQILYHFPHVERRSFKSKYDRIQWDNNEDWFARWCEGTTGYPMVDAGMRELNETGFMHNRVRMVTASFLTKHLLIDWRWGEAYFASKLLDYDLSANNGNWQWVSGSGCDAAPYFRIFNPEEQQKKFDPRREYIRRWVPEVETDRYPKPMVDHKEARQRTLERFKQALNHEN